MLKPEIHLDGALAITVFGTPIPQGSKVANRFGGGVRDANATRLKPWRSKLTDASKDAACYYDQFTGPVQMWIRFTFARPTSHHRTGRNAHLLKAHAPAAPISKNDVDKLQRAVLDALTDAKVWVDDGQVVDVRARKFYAGEHELALDRPGVQIIVTPATDYGSTPLSVVAEDGAPSTRAPLPSSATAPSTAPPTRGALL